MNMFSWGRGGRRNGAGRKSTNRRNVLYVRVSDEAMSIVKEQENASVFIDQLILSTCKEKKE